MYSPFIFFFSASQAMEEVAVSINGQSFIRRWHSFTRTRRLAGHVIGLDRRRPVRREGGTGETAAYAVLVPKKHSQYNLIYIILIQ